VTPLAASSDKSDRRRGVSAYRGRWLRSPTLRALLRGGRTMAGGAQEFEIGLMMRATWAVIGNRVVVFGLATSAV